MLKNKAIENFKKSSLEEKRKIISLYFDAYKRAKSKNYPLALRYLKDANSLWGNSELTIISTKLLEDYQLVEFEKQIERELEDLISLYCPSTGL